MTWKHWVLGIVEGYPICCIRAFARDMDAGRSPALLRRADDGFVPCEKCQEAYWGSGDDAHRWMELV